MSNGATERDGKCCVRCGNRKDVRIQTLTSKYKEDWDVSAANEFGRLAQGVGGRTKGTNTILFVAKKAIPQDRFRDITYGKFVCNVRPQKAEPNRTRLTVGATK